MGTDEVLVGLGLVWVTWESLQGSEEHTDVP